MKSKLVIYLFFIIGTPEIYISDLKVLPVCLPADAASMGAISPQSENVAPSEPCGASSTTVLLRGGSAGLGEGMGAEGAKRSRYRLAAAVPL